jgi:hypothetical protein
MEEQNHHTPKHEDNSDKIIYKKIDLCSSTKMHEHLAITCTMRDKQVLDLGTIVTPLD